MIEPAAIRAMLVQQEVAVDEATLAAVVRWHEAWRREWRHVDALALDDEELPAPLWIWPP